MKVHSRPGWTATEAEVQGTAFVTLMMRVSCGGQSPCRPRASQHLPCMGRPCPLRGGPTPLCALPAEPAHSTSSAPQPGKTPGSESMKGHLLRMQGPQNSEPRPWTGRTDPRAQNSLGSVSDSCPCFQISTKQRKPKRPHYLGHPSLQATPHFLRPRPPLRPPEATSSLRRGPNSSACLWVSAKFEGWLSPSRSRLGGLR